MTTPTAVKQAPPLPFPFSGTPNGNGVAMLRLIALLQPQLRSFAVRSLRETLEGLAQHYATSHELESEFLSKMVTPSVASLVQEGRQMAGSDLLDFIGGWTLPGATTPLGVSPGAASTLTALRQSVVPEPPKTKRTGKRAAK